MNAPTAHPDLFRRIVEPSTARHMTIQERFEAFHAANGWVLQAYVRELLRARARNYKRVGIGFMTEILRWQYAEQTQDASGFKINNDFRSRYTRLILERFPQFEGFITSRELKRK